MSFIAFSQASGRIPESINFRKIRDEDKPFLNRLYASTRRQEMELVDWTTEQKNNFLDMQFEAQHTFYQEQFTEAEFLVIEDNESAIGRIYIDRREKEIRLIDIALLPGSRREGLGTILLNEIMSEGQSKQLPVTIHVEKNNPAMRLYLRLGFSRIEDKGVYDLMRWQPTG